MDPVTVIGLVSSIVQLIEAANKVKDILEAFRDGDKELIALRNDVAAFMEALCGFDRILRSRHTIHRVSSPVLEDVLRNSMEIVLELRDRLLQLSSSSLSPVRRAKWVQHKSALKRLHGKVREKIAMLHTFLSITQAETFLTIASQYPDFMIFESARLAATAESEASKIQPIDPSRLHVTSPGRYARKNSVSSDERGSSVSDTASYMERLSVFSSAASIESYTTVGSANSTHGLGCKGNDPEKLSLTTTNSSQQAIQPVSQDMFILRKSCRYNCRCACHEEMADEPRRRFGRSKPRKIECTDAICLGNEMVPNSSKEYSSLFRSALSKATSTRVIQVRYDLQSFRMVPNGSNAVRYVNHGNLPKLKECIESGEATIWDTTLDGWSLLHSAAYHSHAHIVKYLLDLGVATSTGDVGSRTPADLAVLKSMGKRENGSEQKIVEIFGEKDDVLADFEFNPIHLCVLNMHGHQHSERPSLEELLELVDDANNAPVSTNWTQWKLKFQARSPLFAAILEYFRASAFESPKGTKIIHSLIDEKDKKFHWTPLHWAAYSGRVKEMRTLVKYGANCSILSNLGANIIHAAVESKVSGGLETALKIRHMCPDELDINQANSWGETAVHIASCISASCVQLLLDAGADPNIQDENGRVALHFAASSDREVERPKVITALCIAMGAKHINTQDLHGRPPLFDYLNDRECVETMIQHGAKVDVTDNDGKNAFHHACTQGEHGALEVMLKMTNSPGPLVARDNLGNTPLIEALSNSSVDCAMTLLQRNDVGSLIGKDGWSPIHYATKIGDPELLYAVCRHRSFKKSAKTLDGKSAKVVAMEAETWNGRIKELILEHDCLDWDD
ncbi:ankyrin repeat-containing domain protein [Xylaria bambusicola]|uniref:ankyrin repeat-containing domain protein n=1 Tax=Xylaria bambusicola TaxID=326684 RepID=UPI002008C8A7|nr:ankyrin repeat-containing domain protein [Xylaria bambusicola]KAI0506443.1 ankyrin repeat-containing domain protein [Xylaria bambusicola]